MHCPSHTYKTGKIQRETTNTLTVDASGSILIYKKLPVKNAYSLVQESKVQYTAPKKIAILYIATNKYTIFWNNFYQTAEKNFLPKHQKTYFLFTDDDNMQVGTNVVKIHQDHLPWPYVTLNRFHFFDSIKEKLKEFDYIYFANANLTIYSPVNEEIFPTEEQEIVVTQHAWYYMETKDQFPYERSQKESKSFIPYNEGKYYIHAAFFGGTKNGFLKMNNTLKEWIDSDLKNQIIPIWHDESMLNKYVWNKNKNKEPILVLWPEYLYFEATSPAEEFMPYAKIIYLDKNNFMPIDELRKQTKTSSK